MDARKKAFGDLARGHTVDLINQNLRNHGSIARVYVWICGAALTSPPPSPPPPMV